MTKKRVALIGCGKMGTAIALGLLRAGVATVCAYDTREETRQSLEKTALEQDLRGFKACETLLEALDGAEATFLAVKPNAIEKVLESISTLSRRLLISIAAGVTTKTMRALAPRHRIIRVMSNTPAFVAEGMSVVLADEESTRGDIRLVTELLTPLGEVEVIHDEDQMHAVTALAGSGPAFVAIVAEALSDGAVKEGLSRGLALKLARETLRGTTALLQELHPALLKDAVSSPGGTTIAGLAAAEAAGLRHALIAAISAASERSRALGDKG